MAVRFSSAFIINKGGIMSDFSNKYNPKYAKRIGREMIETQALLDNTKLPKYALNKSTQGLYIYNAWQQAQSIWNKEIGNQQDGLTFTTLFRHILSGNTYSKTLGNYEVMEDKQKAIDIARLTEMANTYSEVREHLDNYRNGVITRKELFDEIETFKLSTTYAKENYTSFNKQIVT